MKSICTNYQSAQNVPDLIVGNEYTLGELYPKGFRPVFFLPEFEEEFVDVLEMEALPGLYYKYPTRFFAPIADIEDEMLSEEQCREIRERQLTSNDRR